MTQGKPEETCGDFGGHRNDGSECGRPSGWGTDFDSGKCRECRGTKPDGSTGEGHGQGDQEGNTNAVKHSLHANRDNLYEYFPDEYQNEVDKIEAALLNRYEEYHGREPDAGDAKDCYELAMGYVQREYARDYMVEEAAESGNPLLSHVEMEKNGDLIEFDKPNEVLGVVNDIRREDRLTRQTKGLEKDPETQKAEAQEDLASLWAAELRE
jgi:hypothetical protein